MHCKSIPTTQQFFPDARQSCMNLFQEMDSDGNNCSYQDRRLRVGSPLSQLHNMFLLCALNYFAEVFSGFSLKYHTGNHYLHVSRFLAIHKYFFADIHLCHSLSMMQKPFLFRSRDTKIPKRLLPDLP